MTKMKIKKMSIHLMQSQSQIVWCNFYYIVYKFLLPVYFITITIYIHISKGNIYFIYVIIVGTLEGFCPFWGASPSRFCPRPRVWCWGFLPLR